MKEFEKLDIDELIASFPLQKRDESNLLVINRTTKKIEHRRFKDIIDYLQKGDCIVINETKVIKARIDVFSDNGTNRDILLLKPMDDDWRKWHCLSKRLSKNKIYHINDELYFTVVDSMNDSGYLICFNREVRYDDLERIGKTPLPNYIVKKRKNSLNKEIFDEDENRYQTVYAKEKGSIAAPTAGFHFTEELLKEIESIGIKIARIVLHIGYGTFKMVKTDPERFIMPKEYARIGEDACNKINSTKKDGKRVFVVGTSSMRTLEKMNDGFYVLPGEGYVDIFIKPGWKFKIADAFITNLHLPHSPPLYMTLAFCGDYELLLSAYRQAVERRYRFYSYGDATLLI